MGLNDKRNALEQLKLGYPPLSLNPMRGSILETFNVEAGPLASATPRTSWPTISRAISKLCGSENERKANLAAGHALYRYAAEKGLTGRHHDFFSLAMGVSRKVTYWSNAVVAIDGKPFVPFIDPRRTRRLTRTARQFVFSVMNERIRVADPDFADVGLAIIQFDNPEHGPRTATPWFDEGIELFSFETLDKMVRETYEMWAEVLAKREADAHEAGKASRGSLL